MVTDLLLAASRALRWPWGLSHTLCTLSIATMVSTSSAHPSSPDASRALPSLGSTGSSAKCWPNGLVNLHEVKIVSSLGIDDACFWEPYPLSQHALVSMQSRSCTIRGTCAALTCWQGIT